MPCLNHPISPAFPVTPSRHRSAPDEIDNSRTNESSGAFPAVYMRPNRRSFAPLRTLLGQLLLGCLGFVQGGLAAV
ncbi:hypothetical protein RGUI_0455 [Rhodovulum sp. P5]|nr:hypothetical protein RGUI_0455 [Rhodovulum sp. P5]